MQQKRETGSIVIDMATARQAALCGTVNQTRDIGFEHLPVLLGVFAVILSGCVVGLIVIALAAILHVCWIGPGEGASAA
jgi:hypothetical protein